MQIEGNMLNKFKENFARANNLHVLRVIAENLTNLLQNWFRSNYENTVVDNEYKLLLIKLDLYIKYEWR